MRYFSCSVTVLKPIAAVLDFVLISLFSLTLSFFHRPLNQSSILPRFFLRLFLFSSSRMVLQHLTLVTSNSHFFANQECNRSCNILELNQIMDWNIFQYFIYLIHIHIDQGNIFNSYRWHDPLLLLPVLFQPDNYRLDS